MKLSEDLAYWRCERPDEWTMDRFIRKARGLEDYSLAGKWVSRYVDLPEHNKCVDVWGYLVGGHHHGDETRYTDCFYDKENFKWWTWDVSCFHKIYLDFMNVTHWMYIPESPKENN